MMKNVENRINNSNNAIALEDSQLDAVWGGNWLTDAWNSATDACGKAWDSACDWVDNNTDTIMKAACIAGGIALCCTGLGVGVVAGAVAVEGAVSAVFTVGTLGTMVGTLGYYSAKAAME